MIVHVYGRSDGRDVKRLTVELSDEHAEALADISAHIAAASPEPLDKVVAIWSVQQVEYLDCVPLPVTDFTDASNNG